MDHVERYPDVFGDLYRRKRWSTGDAMIRYAALTLSASDVVDRGADLEVTAKALAEEAERAGDLKDPAAAANLRAVQAVIEAQQAAMVVCMVACTTVATTSAT
jgi:hypothetical protein